MRFLPSARPRGGPGCAPFRPGRRPTTEGRRLSSKQRGELAELAFLHRAASLGLGVLKPLGDSLPYDVAVDNGRRLLRVQVKSASRPHRGVYEINAGRGRNVKRAYTSRDIDFLAACIFGQRPFSACPEAQAEGTNDQRLSWYIFPLSSFAPRKTIRLSPRRPARWLPYREAWHLLL